MSGIKNLSLVLAFALASLSPLQAVSQPGPSVAKLAKDFSVSPKLLTRFSKSGLSSLDLGKGLSLAKDISGKKNLNMEEVVEQVLDLKQRGQDWPDITKNFGVDLPAGFDSLDLKSLTGG